MANTDIFLNVSVGTPVLKLALNFKYLALKNPSYSNEYVQVPAHEKFQVAKVE